MYFRIGRDIVARRMGWATVDAAGIAKIADRITRNLDAMLDTDGGP